MKFASEPESGGLVCLGMSASVLIKNDTVGEINVVANGLPIIEKNVIFYSSFNNKGLD
jgi:ABC-type xylose transport system substrate-binding protein